MALTKHETAQLGAVAAAVGKALCRHFEKEGLHERVEYTTILNDLAEDVIEAVPGGGGALKALCSRVIAEVSGWNEEQTKGGTGDVADFFAGRVAIT